MENVGGNSLSEINVFCVFESDSTASGVAKVLIREPEGIPDVSWSGSVSMLHKFPVHTHYYIPPWPLDASQYGA